MSLARHDDRLAVGGREDVVGRHHQHTGFELRFDRQRHVDRHLVAVEVGVEGGADQRVKLDGLALDQQRLEGLDAEAVQCRRAVEQHGVLAHDLGQNVPHFGALRLDHALRGLDGGSDAVNFEFRVDERLEQLERHFLRQPALVQLQFRPDHDDRTARVVDPFAQQVLAEAALLAFQHVGQRLQRALVGAGDDAAAAAVVEQRIDRFLQHALLVAHDDVRRAKLQQALQAIVAVDDAAVEVVQVRRREAAAVERHQRAQLRRDDRHHVHDHPFRLVAGFDEALDELQALDQLLAAGFGGDVRKLQAHRVAQFLEVELLEKLLDGFGADHGGEGAFAVLVERFVILLLVEQLKRRERAHARVGDDVAFEIEDLLEVLEHHVDHGRDARGQRLHEPDMRDRRGQLDMAHALAAHFRGGDLDAAFLADDAAILHAFIFTAEALVILDRPEDTGAEQPVPLRLEGAVVDGLRLLHLAERPGANLLRARDRDLDFIELLRARHLAEDIHEFISHKNP